MAPGQYVEVYEHRVSGTAVTTAPQVHHRNGTKSDNDPLNLEHLSCAEHGARHRTWDRDEAERLYAEGQPTTALARRYGVSSATVYRALAARGVSFRSDANDSFIVDEAELRALCAEPGARVPQVAKALGVGEAVVRSRMRRYGIEPFPAGRPVR